MFLRFIDDGLAAGFRKSQNSIQIGQTESFFLEKELNNNHVRVFRLRRERNKEFRWQS
jgi:hypothetical protein